jgi:hypothetical protein
MDARFPAPPSATKLMYPAQRARDQLQDFVAGHGTREMLRDPKSEFVVKNHTAKHFRQRCE